MAVMTILFLGYVLASAINARAVFHVERLDFEYFECVSWLPHSYDRSATWFEFWEYLGLASVVFGRLSAGRIFSGPSHIAGSVFSSAAVVIYL